MISEVAKNVSELIITLVILVTLFVVYYSKAKKQTITETFRQFTDKLDGGKEEKNE